jgi:hypothetical protein
MRVTKKALNEQLRAAFGRNVYVHSVVPVAVNIRIELRRGEGIEELKLRLLKRLGELPAMD